MLEGKNLSPQTLSALVDASAAINTGQDLDETLQAIARAAAAVMRAGASSVIIIDETRDKQIFRAAVGDRADQLLGLEFDRGVGICGKAMEEGKALIVNDVSKDKAHFKEIDEMSTMQTHSLIAAPLVHQDTCLGVVEVLNPAQADRFDEADRELCQLFANLAAIAVANAQRYDSLAVENQAIKQATRTEVTIIGDSAPMREVHAMIRRVAMARTTALILGETGTGKELVARRIHAVSDRADRPFIPINCAALPESLLESELFGHEEGAFTGAVARKLGQFELAHTGTVFLDELGEAPPSIQVKLLRVLENKEITRVGGNRVIPCDVRIIAATNRDLSAEMESDRFRNDLFYRLSVFPIKLPPLRDRRDDIPLLAQHFVRQVATEMKIRPPEISKEAMSALTTYRFPGNVRELQNILERACLLCLDLDSELPQASCIRPEHLPPEVTGASGGAGAAVTIAPPAPGESALASQERAMIVAALQQHDWNQTRAAKALGISRDNLRYRLKKYDIKKPT